MGPGEKGYGQAVGMRWDSHGAPTVLGRYFGAFSNGVPDGHGRLEYEGGNIYEGMVANGQPHGMGKQLLANGGHYWGVHECGYYGLTGGGVGVWMYGISGQTTHGMWDESNDQLPDGLLEELDEGDARIEGCYERTKKAVESADAAAKKAQEAVARQTASESADQALKQGVGQRAYEAMSLRQLFPQGASAVAPGGVVERLERRAATAPPLRPGGLTGGERDTHLLKHKIAKRYATDLQTCKKHEAFHLGADAKARCSPTVKGADTLEKVPAAYNLQPAIYNLQPAAYILQSTICSLQPAACSLQPEACNQARRPAASGDAMGMQWGCNGDSAAARRRGASAASLASLHLCRVKGVGSGAGTGTPWEWGGEEVRGRGLSRAHPAGGRALQATRRGRLLLRIQEGELRPASLHREDHRDAAEDARHLARARG